MALRSSRRANDDMKRALDEIGRVKERDEKPPSPSSSRATQAQPCGRFSRLRLLCLPSVFILKQPRVPIGKRKSPACEKSKKQVACHLPRSDLALHVPARQ